MIRMSQGLMFGTASVDWQDRINMARLREGRAARARLVMRKHGVAAMLVTHLYNCRYLTGLVGPEWMPQLWYVLFFAEHDPVVFHHAGWFQQMPDQAPWIKHWRIGRSWLEGGGGWDTIYEESKQFAADIKTELEERGLAEEKLAIIGFDNTAGEALTSAGIKLMDGLPIIMEAAAIKTEDEISCLKTVANFCEAGWFAVWQSLKPGITETQLSHIAINALYQSGAHEVPPIAVFSGPLTGERGFCSTGRTVNTGDLVYLPLCNIKYLSYQSCTFRTLICGRSPNQKEKDLYKRVLDRMDAVIDAIKPGKTTADAARILLPALARGYRSEAEALTMEVGHGIGMHHYCPPLIHAEWSLKHPQVFEPGMALALEVDEGEPRACGVRVENMIIITKEGPEIIDHIPRDCIMEPPASNRWA